MDEERRRKRKKEKEKKDIKETIMVCVRERRVTLALVVSWGPTSTTRAIRDRRAIEREGDKDD